MIAYTHDIGACDELQRTSVAYVPGVSRMAFQTDMKKDFDTTTVAVEAIALGPTFHIDAEVFLWVSTDLQFKMYNLAAFTGGISDDGGGPGTTVSRSSNYQPPFWARVKRE